MATGFQLVPAKGPFCKEVGLKHSPTLQVNLLTKGHPRGRASFHGPRRVLFSLSLTDNKYFAHNGEQAAYCDAINFTLVVTINCLQIILL